MMMTMRNFSEGTHTHSVRVYFLILGYIPPARFFWKEQNIDWMDEWMDRDGG